MIFLVNHQLQLSGNKMEKSNYKEWSVDFNGKTIKVSNWWNWEGKSSADLYLDNEHLDQNTDMLVNPNKAMLSKSEVSDDICLLYTSPSPRDTILSRMPSSA